MSSRSLTSSPTRCIGAPQSAFGQVVSSGSWRCSTRCRCSGSAWRRGRRGASLGAAGIWGSLACKAASCACRSASSSASVWANSARCCAVIASVLAPNFQRFRRASSMWIFCSRASRQAISRSLRSISRPLLAMSWSLLAISCVCCSMRWRMRSSTACTGAGSVCSSMSLRPSMYGIVPHPPRPHHWRKHRCQHADDPDEHAFKHGG